MDIQISLDLKGKLVQNPHEFMAGLLRQLKTDMGLAGKYVQGEVKSITPVGATGHLRDGIKSTVFQQGDNITALVAPDKEYAFNVEHGTARHWAPFKPLLYYVTRKYHLSGEQAIAAAKGLQKGIAIHGTRKQQMFGKTAARPEVIAKIKHLIELGIASYIARS